VAARLAAKRGDAQKAPQKRKRAGNIVGRDAHQFRIPTYRTMGMQGMAKRHEARVETTVAVTTPPRVDAYAAD